MVVELEKSWEPPWEGAPHQEAAVDDDHVPGLMDMSDDEDNDEVAPCWEVRTQMLMMMKAMHNTNAMSIALLLEMAMEWSLL